MSLNCFRQAYIQEVAPMSLKDDRRTSGISSPLPGSPALSLPLLAVENVWSLSSEYHLKDITLSRGHVDPHEQIMRYQEEYLTDIIDPPPGYEWPPKRMEGTTQLKWQVSASDSSFGVSGERSSTGNVWDMLVGLLGSEKGDSVIRTTERLSTCTSYESEFLINAMTSCNPKDSGGKSCEATDKSTKDGYQLSVSFEDFHPSKNYRSLAVNDDDKLTYKHKFPLIRNKLQVVPLQREKISYGTLCTPECPILESPKEEYHMPQRSEPESDNKGGAVYKVFDNAISVKMFKADKFSSKSELHMKNPSNSSLITKSIQQHYEKSYFDENKSKRKEMVMSKQRGKNTRKKIDKVPFKRNKSTLLEYPQVLELPKVIIKPKPRAGTPLALPSVNNVQSAKTEHLQDSVVQVSKIVDKASLEKKPALTIQDYKGSQDVLVLTDTLMKFLNPLSDCGRLHPILMSSQENENGFPDTMVIEFNVCPSLSLENKSSLDMEKNASVVKQMRNTNQSQCFTGLFMPGQGPKRPSVMSKLGNTKMLKVAELWEDKGEANATLSLTNDSQPPKEKNSHIPELSNTISKLAQPKLEVHTSNITNFLTNESRLSDDKSGHFPELTDIISRFSQPKIKESWKDEDAAKVTESFTNASKSLGDKKSQETETAPVRETRKCRGLDEDFFSSIPSARSLKSRERWNVKSPALPRSSRIQQNSSGSVAAVEEGFPPEQQLKLLLHARHCRMVKCGVDSCHETKVLLRHCYWCREETMCRIPCCSISKTLSKHWDACKVFHCPLCTSLRQCYGQARIDIKGTRGYSSNYNTVKYGPYMANSSSKNITNPSTSKFNVRNSSLPTSASKSHEATVLPKTIAGLQSHILFGDKYKPSKSPQRDDLQEKSGCRTQFVEKNFSDVCQTGWDFPLGNNDLGENLNHILWSNRPEEDIHPETATEFVSKKEGPKLAAGFTMLAEHLRDRLDCLLHGVACEEPDNKASGECTMKHCSIMKSSVIHMSSCNEFQFCSNVICLLFSPLFLHWKKCCGSCAVCGPINMKYNKKKLLKKLPSALAKSEIISEETVFNRHRLSEHTWRASSIAAPYYLREYMMMEELSIPAVNSGCSLQLAGSKKSQAPTQLFAGNTWDQLTGIDLNKPRFLENSGKPDVCTTVFSEPRLEQSSSYSGYNESSDTGMQDLLAAISLYNSVTGI